MATDEVASLRAQLEEKQLELDNHQAFFDTYVREREALDKEYEGYCTQYEEQIENLEKDLAKCKSALDESGARQAKSNTEASRLTAEVSELHKKVVGMENIKRQLETTNDDLENKARALEAEVVVLREKNDHLLEEKVLVSHELEDLRVKQSEVQERLKQELRELREDVEAHRQEETSDATVEGCSQQLQETEEKLKESEARAQDLEKQVKSLRKLLEEQSKTARSVTNKYDQARGILDQYKSNHTRMQSLQDEVLQLQESLVAQQSQTEIGRKLRDTEAILRARDSQTQSLEAELKSSKQRAQSLQEELQNVKHVLAAQSEARGALQEQFLKKFGEMEELIKARDGRIQTLEKQLEESGKATQRADGLVKQVLEMKKSLDDRAEAVIKLNDERKKLVEQAKSSSQQIQNLQQEVERLRQPLSVPSPQALSSSQGNGGKRGGVSDEQAKALEAQVGDLQKASSEARDRAKELEATLKEKEAEVRLWISKAGDMDKEMESKALTLSSLEEQLLKVKAERDAALAYKALSSETEEEMSGLQSYLEQTQTELAEQAATITTLEDQLAKAKDLASIKDKASSAAASELMSLKASLEEKMKELAAQAAAIKALQEELVKVKAQRDHAMANLSSLGEEVSSSTAMLEEIASSDASHTHLVARLQAKLRETEDKRDELSDQVVDHAAALEELESRQAEMEAAHQGLGEEVASLRSQVHSLTVERDQAVESLARARQEVQECHVAKREKEDVTLRAKELEEEVERLCKQIDEDNGVINEQNERIQMLVEQVDVTSREAADQALAVKAAEEQLQAGITSDKELELLSHIADLEAMIADLRRKRGQEAVDRALASGDIAILREQLHDINERYKTQRLFNSRLLSRLQNTQTKIQVCCRIRPLNEAEATGDGNVIVEALSEFEVGYLDKKTGSSGWRSFAFDRVWGPQHTQEDVFLDVEPLALSTINGCNACIFAYGQTGSGKTFTMQGSSEVEYGISYRVMHKMLEILNLRKDTEGKQDGEDQDDGALSDFDFEVQMAMVEVYNEDIRDLLRPNGPGVNLDIRRDADGVLQIPGMVQERVTCLEDAAGVIDRGNKNRATASTNIHEHSSRSHSVLIVDVATSFSGVNATKGRLYLIDLAGSERVKKSAVTGTELREAQYINRSLSALGDVMEALDNKSGHVPYRNSRLTYLLQDSLGGDSRTLMIVTVSPMDETADESLCTLHFATRVRSITLAPAASHLKIKNLEQEVKACKKECRMLSQKRALSEEALAALKKAHAAAEKRANVVIDSRNQSIEQTKKIMEDQLTTLRNHTQELAAKFQQEKTYREKLAVELDESQREVRKLQSQVESTVVACSDLKALAVSKEMEIMDLKRSFRYTRRGSPSDISVMATTSFKPIALPSSAKPNTDGGSVSDDRSETDGGSTRGVEQLLRTRRDSNRGRRSSPNIMDTSLLGVSSGAAKSVSRLEESVTGAGIESRSSPPLPLPPESEGDGEGDDVSFISKVSSSSTASAAKPPPPPDEEKDNNRGNAKSSASTKGQPSKSRQAGALPRVAILAMSAASKKPDARTLAKERKAKGPTWKN